MKKINEINLQDYKTFYLTNEYEDFKVYSYTSDGYVEIYGYDLIQTDAGVLIGYKDIHVGHNGHSYVVNNVRKFFSCVDFNQASYALGHQYSDKISFFMFVNSIKNPSLSKSKDINGKDIPRCDLESYGASVYYEVPEQYSLLKVFNVLDLPGIGHIVFFEVFDDQIKNIGTYVSNTVARTMPGIIKVIKEWADVSKEPFLNTEEISIDANDFINSGIFSNAILDWCSENQVDMRVSRYLKTGETPSGELNEVDEYPSFINDFFKSKWRYENIASIKLNHPNGHMINNDLLYKEFDLFKPRLYEAVLLAGIEDSPEKIEEFFINDKTSDTGRLYWSYKNLGLI